MTAPRHRGVAAPILPPILPVILPLIPPEINGGRERLGPSAYGGGMIALPGRRPPLLLELDLTQPPADPDLADPIDRLQNRGRRLLRPTLRALHEAGSDGRVGGLIAKVGGQLPWSVMQELRAGVLAFAESGKPTVAWAESFGESGQNLSGYVLATAFGEIWLQPGGEIGALGVGVMTLFTWGVCGNRRPRSRLALMPTVPSHG